MRSLLAVSTLLPALVFAHATAHGEAEPPPAPSEPTCHDAPGHVARVVDGPALDTVTAVRGFAFAELVLEHAPTPSIVIEGAPTAVRHVVVDARSGVVTFSTSGCIRSATPLRITVSAPSFDEITVTSGARVLTSGVVQAADLTIELEEAGPSQLEIAATGEVVLFANGASRHAVAVEARSVVAMHAGTGDITLSGRVQAASLSQRGLGAIFARSLQAIEEIVSEADGGVIFARR